MWGCIIDRFNRDIHIIRSFLLQVVLPTPALADRLFAGDGLYYGVSV